MTQASGGELCQVISLRLLLLRVYHCANPYINPGFPRVAGNLWGRLTTSCLGSRRAWASAGKRRTAPFHVSLPSTYLGPTELMRLIYMFLSCLIESAVD